MKIGKNTEMLLDSTQKARCKAKWLERDAEKLHLSTEGHLSRGQGDKVPLTIPIQGRNWLFEKTERMWMRHISHRFIRYVSLNMTI